MNPKPPRISYMGLNLEQALNYERRVGAGVPSVISWLFQLSTPEPCRYIPVDNILPMFREGVYLL